MENVIHRFKNSHDGEVRISNLIRENKSYVDVRVYTQPVSGRKWRPTDKGFMVEANFIPELVLGFEKALEGIAHTIDRYNGIGRKVSR